MHAPQEVSEIDDPSYFLDSNGKYDLSAELDTTIIHLNDQNNRGDKSPFCKFPARRAWLESELNVSFGNDECKEYDDLLKKLDPQKVTLVFPSAHINSPASMFGHTFLRIDSKMESKLMSYAINYAAHTDESNGLAFAYKGLFGGYYGYYSMLPYYEKLKEYRDSESRDVWEYDLNLSETEVLRMVKHIWELQKIFSNYFFFDENCSYHMLWLTEIARPTIHLRNHFDYYVIPPETVKAFETEKLVLNKSFRPSKRTKLLAYESQLNNNALNIARGLSTGELNSTILQKMNFSLQEKQYILESAAELVEYGYIEGKIPKELYVTRYYSLLSERALLGQGIPLSIREKTNPDKAHHAQRLQFMQSFQEKTNPFLLGIRPAYHSLQEDDTGHLSGAQIEFLDILLQVDQKNINLEKLTILSLASMVPVTNFFQPFSWRMKSGWDRDYGDNQTSFVTRIGAGTSIGNDQTYTYFLSEPEIRLGFNSDIGLGFTLGSSIQWENHMKSFIELKRTFYLDNTALNSVNVSHLWQWNASLSLFAKYELYDQKTRNQKTSFGINLYF